MAFGDSPHDEALSEAWFEFCEQLKRAGERVFKDDNGISDVERAGGFQFLTQNLSQAFDIWLENNDTRFPYLHAFNNPVRKLGCDDADCIYFQSWINDRDTYRISGTIGTARMFNIAVQGPWAGHLHEPFGDTPYANVFGHELDVDWDGRFELWISPEEHEGNWIRSRPGTRKIFYRQYFDRWDEQPGRFRIERVGIDGPPPRPTPQRMIDAMDSAGRFVVACVNDWPETLFDRNGNRDHVNEFRRHGNPAAPDIEQFDTRRGRLIQDMYWQMAPNEAMIIEFESPPERFWQVTNCDMFGGSMDFRYRQVSLTSANARRDPDGRIRIVLTHADPGFANWIDTQGHGRGWFYFRNVQTREATDLRTRVVELAALDEILRDSPRVTHDQRVQDLHLRLDAMARRYAF